MATPPTDEITALPATALPFVFARLPARQLCLAAAVSRDWRRAAAAELRRAVRLDNEADAGRALRSLAALRPPLAATLETLSLEFARGVVDADVAALAGPALRSANLNATFTVGDDAVLALAAACPRLEELSLYWNLRVSDGALAALAAAPCAASLARLGLSGCKRVTDAGIAALARSLPALTSLDLTRCPGVGDAGLRALAASPAALGLTELVLYADAQFGSAALAELLRCCGPSLRRLDLCGAAQLTDDALLALVPGSSDGAPPLKLETLNLTWCVQLHDAALARLLAACPALRWLSLHGINGVGAGTLDALAASAHTLQALDVRGCATLPPQERTPDALRRRLPALRAFVLHS